MSDYTELDAAIANLNLEYSARFVPWRQSRNKDQEQPTINWVITLKRPGAVINGVLTTNYSEGIAHVPGYNGSDRSKLGVERIEQAVTTGSYYTSTNPRSKGMKPLPEPKLRDVLYCLVLDTDVLESSGFEDWASNYGYDTDSRKAEAMYRACIEIALSFRVLIGQEALDKLRELYQGY